MDFGLNIQAVSGVHVPTARLFDVPLSSNPSIPAATQSQKQVEYQLSNNTDAHGAAAFLSRLWGQEAPRHTPKNLYRKAAEAYSRAESKLVQRYLDAQF